MLYLITASEKQFIIDTLNECIRVSDDVEDACEECLEILCNLYEREEDEFG